MKYPLCSLVVLLAVSAPAVCRAQEFGSKGDAVFSVERVMGITGDRVHDEVRNNGFTRSTTEFSFGWRMSPSQSPFEVPRFAFDYLVIDHLSVGGALGYASLDPDDGNSASIFLFAPRVGYAYAFGRVVAIWPRGGLTYHNFSTDGDEQKGLALSLECPFTFSPATHFAFEVGPSLDFDMFGSRDLPVDSGDHTYRSIGLHAGLVGWF